MEEVGSRGVRRKGGLKGKMQGLRQRKYLIYNGFRMAAAELRLGVGHICMSARCPVFAQVKLPQLEYVMAEGGAEEKSAPVRWR